MDEPLKNKPEETAPADDQEVKLAEVSKAEAEEAKELEAEVQTQSTQPVAQSVVTEIPKTGSSAGIIILQWLTYAFWGWTILSLVWLIFIVVASLITSIDTTSMVPYAIAAALVLLPISLVCDIFYGKHEPVKKTGASMVVMVIHAVIFALFGIGMLITGVLTVVQVAIGSSSDTDFQTVWIITAFVSAVVYAVTFLRTLNPLPKLRLVKFFPIVMALIVGAFIVAGFIGPVAQASLTKDDRVITSTISDVSRAVESYASSNDKLPSTLSDVDLSGDAKDAVDRGLYTFKPEGPVKKSFPDGGGNGIDVYDSYGSANSRTEYRYQLCVTYKKADSERNYNSYRNTNEYSSNPYTYGHPQGEVCYKLNTPTYCMTLLINLS